MCIRDSNMLCASLHSYPHTLLALHTNPAYPPTMTLGAQNLNFKVLMDNMSQSCSCSSVLDVHTQTQQTHLPWCLITKPLKLTLLVENVTVLCLSYWAYLVFRLAWTNFQCPVTVVAWAVVPCLDSILIMCTNSLSYLIFRFGVKYMLHSTSSECQLLHCVVCVCVCEVHACIQVTSSKFQAHGFSKAVLCIA